MRLLLISLSTLTSEELAITFQMIQSEEDHQSFCFGTIGVSWEEQLGFFSGTYTQKERSIQVKNASCNWYLKTLVYPVSPNPLKLMKFLNAIYSVMNLNKFDVILVGTTGEPGEPLNLQDFIKHEHRVVDKQIVTALARKIAQLLKPENALFVAIMDLINPESLENTRLKALQQLGEVYIKMESDQAEALIEQFQFLARQIFMEPFTRLHENPDNKKMANLLSKSCFILGQDNRIQIKPNSLILKNQDNLQTSWINIGKKLGLEFAADTSWINRTIFLTPQSSMLCIKKGIMYDHDWIKKQVRNETINKMITFKLGMFHNPRSDTYLSPDPVNHIASDLIKLCKL